MSGLAAVLLSKGERVSGCDTHEGPVVARLRAMGAEIFLGHDPSHLAERPRIVVSSAIREDEPELSAARSLGLEIRHRGDILADLFQGRRGVAVCGTHGKSTTTGMVAMALRSAGTDPTVLAGADLRDLGGNAILGSDSLVVAEADESDGSFTKISPTVAVITNVDDDHLDHYGSMEKLVDAFRIFAGRVQPGGTAVLCGDDDNARRLCDAAPSLVYGLREPAELTAVDIEAEAWGSEFQAVHRGRRLGRVKLQIPGLHNVANALAAIGAGLSLGLEAEALFPGLAEFHGATRRFQVLGRVGDVTVIDDYAHHPTEIATTLRVARGLTPGRLFVLFQPHRYSRTRNLANEFGPAFSAADRLFLVPIYPAGEEPLPGVHAGLIEASVTRHGRPDVARRDDREALVDEIANLVRPGDVVMVMGAGDIRKDGERLVSRLAACAPAGSV